MSTSPSVQGPEWSSGLCDCCAGPHANPGFFCGSICCSVVTQGVLLKDAGLVDTWAYPTIGYALLDAISGGAGQALQMLAFVSLRSNMAAALGREEAKSVCQTCCISYCCYPCALAQVHRDLCARDYRFRPNASLVNTMVGGIEDKTPLVAVGGI